MSRAEVPEAPTLAGRLSSMKGKGRAKGGVEIRATVFDERFGPDNKWRKEEVVRYKREIAAIQNALATWNPENVATKAKKSLTAELALKRARLAEAKAQLKV